MPFSSPQFGPILPLSLPCPTPPLPLPADLLLPGCSHALARGPRPPPYNSQRGRLRLQRCVRCVRAVEAAETAEAPDAAACSENACERRVRIAATWRVRRMCCGMREKEAC
eukprot:2491733-Pleurochrysis_carterae.AAC.1